MDFFEVGERHFVEHSIEDSLGSTVALDAIEAVEAFLPEVDFFEFGVRFEPFKGGRILEVIEFFATGEQEFSNGESPLVSRDGFPVSRDHGVEQTQHVKLIGDQVSIGKPFLGKGFVGFGEIEDDMKDPLWFGDVSEAIAKRSRVFAWQHFQEPFAIVIGDDGDKRDGSGSSFLEAMLIDPNNFGPGVLTLPDEQIELLVKSFVEEPC